MSKNILRTFEAEIFKIFKKFQPQNTEKLDLLIKKVCCLGYCYLNRMLSKFQFSILNSLFSAVFDICLERESVFYTVEFVPEGKIKNK